MFIRDLHKLNFLIQNLDSTLHVFKLTDLESKFKFFFTTIFDLIFFSYKLRCL